MSGRAETPTNLSQTVALLARSLWRTIDRDHVTSYIEVDLMRGEVAAVDKTAIADIQDEVVQRYMADKSLLLVLVITSIDDSGMNFMALGLPMPAGGN